jgi:hypothetical protein
MTEIRFENYKCASTNTLFVAAPATVRTKALCNSSPKTRELTSKIFTTFSDTAFLNASNIRLGGKEFLLPERDQPLKL